MPKRQYSDAIKKRQQDALSLARLAYDIYIEEKLDAKIKIGGHNAKARDRNSSVPSIYTRTAKQQ